MWMNINSSDALLLMIEILGITEIVYGIRFPSIKFKNINGDRNSKIWKTIYIVFGIYFMTLPILIITGFIKENVIALCFSVTILLLYNNYVEYYSSKNI